MAPARESPPSVDQSSRFRFAGLLWGSSDSAVVVAMRQQGLQLTGPNEDGDLYFRGRITYERALVTAGMANGRLARITVVLTPPSEDAIRVYRQVVSTLRNRYGEPTQQVASFDPPFAEGDSRALEALRAGKGNFAARWDTVQDSESLRIAITNEPSIVLFYENTPVWRAEEARRKEKKMGTRP